MTDPVELENINSEIEVNRYMIKEHMKALESLWRRRFEGERVGDEIASYLVDLKRLADKLEVLELRKHRLEQR